MIISIGSILSFSTSLTYSRYQNTRLFPDWPLERYFHGHADPKTLTLSSDHHFYLLRPGAKHPANQRRKKNIFISPSVLSFLRIMSLTKFSEFFNILRYNLMHHSQFEMLIRPVVLQASTMIPRLTNLTRECSLSLRRMLRFHYFLAKFNVSLFFIVSSCSFCPGFLSNLFLPFFMFLMDPTLAFLWSYFTFDTFTLLRHGFLDYLLPLSYQCVFSINHNL